ncbi:MAG: methyltransferase domain-containing protein [Bacteroidetes bacterium]|nr:methyltransferase domain-containing protein [Bacteroidota bacterium]
MDSNPLTRFSKTVDNYIRYRPGYPADLLDFMKTDLGLSSNSVIADIGAGTGKLTELFLENGNPVHAVEPNIDMRTAMERLYGHFENLHSVDGTAEATNLPDECADFVLAAQAFHWFDGKKTNAEFQRISKPNAWALIIWNDRNDARSAFMQAYTMFLAEYSTDLATIDHRNIGKYQLTPFFGKNGFAEQEFDYLQRFDFAGVRGRYLSSSYAFHENHPRHAEAMQALSNTFATHAENGVVDFWYLTKIYFGRMI